MLHADQSEIRSRLQNELIDRCKKNPRYSMRSFARFLSVEPSALSKILKGTRKISDPFFEKVSHRLGWAPQLNTSSKDLSLDIFEAISNWYYFAILELTTVSGFKSDSKWVAQKLGVSVVEVDRAVETLKRIDYLNIDQHGNWRDVSGFVTTLKHPITSAAFRRLQSQILEQAREALENTPFEERDQSAMTMAIDSKKLAQAKERIKSFRRSLCAFLQSGERDSVYQLSVSLFPVTKRIQKTQSKEKQK